MSAKMCARAVTRFVMRQVRDATAQILDHLTLQQVCDHIQASKVHVEGEQVEELMYYI